MHSNGKAAPTSLLPPTRRALPPPLPAATWHPVAWMPLLSASSLPPRRLRGCGHRIAHRARSPTLAHARPRSPTLAHARPRSPTLAHARCTRRAASGEFLERSGDVADGMRVGGAPRWPRRELAAERRAPAVDAAMGAAMSAARRRQLPGGGDFGVGGADGEASREKEIAASLVLSRVTRAMRGSVGSWGHATDLLHAVLPRREPLALRAFGVEGGGCGVRRVLCTSRVGAYHAGLCT